MNKAEKWGLYKHRQTDTQREIETEITIWMDNLLCGCDACCTGACPGA